MKKAFDLSIPELLADVCQPSRCGILIYDMQVGIVPQIPTGRAVLDQCSRLLAAARAKGYRIFFARHFFLPLRVSGVGQLRRSMIWQQQDDPSQLRELIPYGSPGWQIAPELAPQPDEILVDKITMSAFEGTFLNIAMRDAHLDSFVVAGIALEIGIEPTVRQALDLNYVPVVVADACGSKTRELQEHSLATLRETGEVLVASTDEVVGAL
jgi:nicotinamidase-related amidase